MMGVLAHQAGRNQAAVDLIRQAIAHDPSDADAYGNLGSALVALGECDHAIISCAHAIKLRPNHVDATYNLGVALKCRGRREEAVTVFRQVLRLRPDHVQARVHLGNILKDQGHLDGAIAEYQLVLVMRPNYADALCNLGNALMEKKQLDLAITAYKQAIALNPNLAEAHGNMGSALKSQGNLDESIASLRRAITLRPGYSQAHSNLLLSMMCHPGHGASSIVEEQHCWEQQHADPLARLLQHSNDPDPNRRLRIGFVSPDFRNHVVGRNLLPMFRRWDRDESEIFCYSNAVLPDAMTLEFQQLADEWRNISGLSDHHAVELIRQDQIDILMDLALHTNCNRLLIFARKPAPVQVSFAGYPGRTGLQAIEYRLSDPYLDPPSAVSTGIDPVIRLPHSFWCYDPLENADIPVNSLPALNAGFFTFACLNNFCKVNTTIQNLWAQVLWEVPSSRLLMLADPGSYLQQTIAWFAQQGIEPGRIQFVPSQPRREYLKMYHQIDLCLDSLPYNGHTTSLDSLWMGVPVVTLVGQTIVGRAGLSQLINLGLEELVAWTPEQYVRIATDLAGDSSRLSELRRTLRQRLQASALMDSVRFTQGIQDACRIIWQRWCGT